ncbi:hypothetical protein M3Y99_01455400 [Aphelenchoides fujianensis]|nr:hypothetical protein M3Y99_01455400 [Aphelenchoides fujianensis]
METTNEETEECIASDLPPTAVLPPAQFPSNNRCCFGCFHVHKIAKCLLVYHALLLTAVLIVFFRESAALLVPLAVFFVASGWALWRGKADWLWPFIVYVGISVGLLVLLSAYLFFQSVLQQHATVEDVVLPDSSSEIPLWPTAVQAANFAAAAFHSWQVFVLLAARRFLRRVQIVRKERRCGRADSVQTTTSAD